MGKLQSRHVCRSVRVPREAECFFVNAHLNKALEEQIWKKKTGFNLANYNMDESISELSICLEDKDSGVPLRVELPPQKSETETSKVLKLDQMAEEDQKDKSGKVEDIKGESRLSIEEFECGVQFEGSENSKQEWSFTLYDFDGHGRITKEDLASLLKALYDAVGSSIKLPPNGTKTLKLRLTVGQDNTQIQVQRASPTKGKENGKSKESKTKDSIRIKELSKLNNFMQPGSAKVNNETQSAAAVTGTKTTTTTTTTTRNQLSLEDQQQLVELVQENMERNHIKQLRRHHSDCRNMMDHQHHHKRRHRNHCSHEDRPKESQDRRNYYLDLAGVENNTSKFQNNPTVPTAGSGFVQTGHHRSRSHDVTKKFDNVKRESERLAKHLEGSKPDHPRSRSFDPQETTAVCSPKGHSKNPSSPHKHSSKFRPVSLPAHVPATVSPHYHRRHRHREKDHGLAMQQVAEWIEREHAWEMEGEHVMVQRHEHHHIHEHHHHHHYHHYYEA
ncbi:protein naked cuticle homolog 2-like isoform X1 [Haliotis asinina]|uniref:protein naked cuticle homolog 2-like isoform X1 n=1 Tax=Haliotis asinina TaxID=109174 RepID=UPI0035327135